MDSERRALGEVLGCEADGTGHRLRLARGLARIEALGDCVLRLRVTQAQELQPYASYALREPRPGTPAELRETGDVLELRAGAAAVRVDTSAFAVTLCAADGAMLSRGEPFYAQGRALADVRLAAAGEDYYGLGERVTPFGRRGYIVENWNRDVFRHHNETTQGLYVSMPFFVGYTPGAADRLWGYFLDSSYRSVFDMASSDWRRLDVRVDRGDFVLYLMTADSWPAMLEQYTELTGRHRLPPLWALGHHQSRYGIMTTAEAWEIARGFRDRDIPCDSLWYDIDHMDDFRVFTFDPVRFADVKDHFWGLGEQGFRKVVIVDPGVKADPPGVYRVADEGARRGYFLKTMDGEDFVGPVWPGGTKFPDFTRPDVRRWWADLHAVYLDLGVDGVWNDMNEPAVMDERETIPEEVRACDAGRWSTQDRMHNVYAMFEAQATLEALQRARPAVRPFVLTRAGSPGIQRLAAVWTGDNTSTWAHLRASIGQLVNLGLSGIGFCGADVGGFSENAQPELLVRWYQLAAFYPFLRNHSMKGTAAQEPWAFGAEAEALIREAIRLRYRLLPYLYQLFHRMCRTGEPVLRPLLWHYAGARAAAAADPLLCGPDVMVAPVLEPGARERLVWLPPGLWVDAVSGEPLQGGRSFVATAPLERAPLFFRGGSVIPVAEPAISTAFIDRETLILEVRPGGPAEGILYEDDGETDTPALEHRYRLEADGGLRLDVDPATGYRRVVVRRIDGGAVRRWSGSPGVIDLAPGDLR